MATYPLATFHFTVEWGGTRVGFSEVTGLTQENQAIEYRDGSFPEYSSIKMLLDEEHQPVMVWKVMNAFPVKVEGPQLKAAGNEVAIESVEIAHEGLELHNE